MLATTEGQLHGFHEAHHLGAKLMWDSLSFQKETYQGRRKEAGSSPTATAAHGKEEFHTVSRKTCP